MEARHRPAVLAVLALILPLGAGRAGAQGSAPLQELLARGDLPAAEAAARPEDPAAVTDAELALAVGRLHLFRNELDRAEAWLGRARELSPEASAPALLLAETFRRRDRFAEAAPILRAAGREAEARQIASFGDARPYRIEGPESAVAIPFRQTDPLPILPLAVNGKEALFLLDTGGAELILDPEYAAAVGVELFGTSEGTFAGGKKAETGLGRVASVRLGELTVHDVPVATLPTRRFGAVCGGCQVDGVLGTVLLYHFQPTIDYPGGKLVLRRRGAGAAGARAAHTIPFWMAGDHYLLAMGTLNGAGPLPMFVDTGLAGPAFTAPESTLREAGIEVPEGQGGEGIGGGGAVRVVPFQVESLTLGSARREKLMGVFGPFPPQLEHAHGVRIAGIVSHAFLRPWAVTFDFDAMELRLEAPAGD